MTHKHTQKRKFMNQTVHNIEWEKTDGQTDGQMDITDWFPFPANAVGTVHLVLQLQC